MKKLKIRIKEFDDQTGLYGKVKMKFEDELANFLRQEKVEIITNPRDHFIQGKRKETLLAVNIFEPILAIKTSASVASADADIILTGIIEEIYFGNSSFNPAAYHSFGLLGAAMAEGKIAKVTLKLKAVSTKDDATLFDSRVEAMEAADRISRAEAIDAAMKQAVTTFGSHLLRKN